MNQDVLINWLLEGDISIQYQVHRDLLDEEKITLRTRIAKEGWAKALLNRRHFAGHWGQAFYQPKWISTHYTLLDLRNLWVLPENKAIQESLDQIFAMNKGADGSIHCSINKNSQGDVCVNGMFLNYASYFKAAETKLKSVVDFLLLQVMPDGGFNCRSNRSGAKHSSLHSTLSVLEGIEEYKQNGYQYRLSDLIEAAKSSVEFILLHQLFISDRTGQVIHKDFLRLSYPRRWRFDILSALDYFQYAKIPLDNRMESAIQVLLKKRNKDGTWNLQAKIPGQTHFDMERAGRSSHWNTLWALRVLKYFGMLKNSKNVLERATRINY